MDAVELPLPARVVVSILGNNLLATCSSSQGDITYPVHPSEQNSVSKSKKADAKHGHKSLFPNFDGEESNRQRVHKEMNNSFLMLPDHPGKQLRRKAVKVPSSSPCGKRPRTDQLGDSTTLIGHDDSIVVCGKIGLISAKCNSAEKSRVAKQKLGQDGKRGDKRNFRAVVKTKFDPLTSSGSTIGANNILGIYGLKSDIHDVTKHMDELSLKDLIDGTYKSPNTIRDSEKNTSNNESFMLSVRKACSILPLYRGNHPVTVDAVDGSCDREPAACRLSAGVHVANKKESDNFMTEISPSSKDVLNKSGTVETPRGIPLYQPKEIHERLALSPVSDLGSLISHTPVPALPSLQRLPDLHSGTATPQSASLPPFPWSLLPSGSCKANQDHGKLSANRNACQNRWIRIGSSTGLFGSIHSRYSDQEFRCDHSSVPLGEPKFNELLAKTASQPVSSCSVVSLPASQVPCQTILKNGPIALSSDCPSEPTFPEGYHESHSECYLKNCSTLQMPFLSLDTRDSEKCPVNEETCMGLSQNFSLQKNECASVQAENSKATTDWRTDSNCYFPSQISVGGSEQHLRHFPLAENSKYVGHSPRLLAAAQTLCEIASYWSNDRGNQYHDSSKVRWPRRPSQKTMKAPKPRSTTGKTVEVFAASTKPGDPVRSMGNILSPRHADKKKNLIHINHVHRGSVKWSATNTIGNRYPAKLGGDPVAHTKQLSAAESVKLFSMMREDGICNNSQQKLRKAAVASAPAGNQAKELVRRSKKEW